MKKGFNLVGLVFVAAILSTTLVNGQSLDTGTVYLPQNSIWNANGKVGISTRTPKAYLDVADTARDSNTSILGRLSEGNSMDGGTYLGVHAYNTQPIYSASFALEHRFYGELNSAITFYRGIERHGGFITFSTSDGSEKMRLDQFGNLTIGTTTSTAYRLTVEGTAAARRVKVTQQPNWADFVFQQDYQLPSLQEVENYINVNKHLSGIPSAEEVQKEGIDLGEMNKLLLQKIEELTLYLIKQEKQQQKMQEQINALQSKTGK